MSELDQYDYELPTERIAQWPLPVRSDARLMLVNRKDQSIEHFHVRDLPELLRAGDALVMNNSRVIPARLVGRRAQTGARWTGLFVESDHTGAWRILGKTRGKLLPGERIQLYGPTSGSERTLTLVAKQDGGVWVATPDSDESPFQILDQVGWAPLPHYIRDGEMSDQDRERYQTVYADRPGSIAAPTAGLHFTADLLAKLKNQGVEQYSLTLHVGLGTFRPIASDRLSDHQMHFEWAEVSPETAVGIERARAKGRRVVSVGTTTVRTLESAALHGPGGWQGTTNLFIRPPFTFRATDALMTNFHLPRSTLLVLVRTFGGDDLIKRAYNEAIHERYRFYSYGDAMLII